MAKKKRSINRVSQNLEVRFRVHNGGAKDKEKYLMQGHIIFDQKTIDILKLKIGHRVNIDVGGYPYISIKFEVDGEYKIGKYNGLLGVKFDGLTPQQLKPYIDFSEDESWIDFNITHDDWLRVNLGKLKKPEIPNFNQLKKHMMYSNIRAS